jgi:EAL domain-containing protein (putative c-di-GMP-specific phosphodiesterase class I)
MTKHAEGASVLVVDDDPQLLEICDAVLTEAGYRVALAGDGAAALAILAKQTFDVVLTDISMPGMNGLQLLRAVRRRDLDVPVLLMTGNPEMATAVEALEQGAMRYLVKPLTADEITGAVEKAVRLRRFAALKRQALTELGASGDRLVGDRAGLEAIFDRALETLWMAYQPIVSAGDGRVMVHEALVRTGEPTLAEPSALFHAAERLGRVPELGRAIRGRIAGAMNGVPKGARRLFVNLHPQELADDSLYSDPLSAKAGAIVLEVTERAPLDDLHDLRSRIGALRELGYQIAVDDLGSGYAGLNSFATLEPDVVKLDIALVRGVDEEPIKRKLVSSMTDLCRQLGIVVVAEGVETSAERDVLVHLKCDLLQGFLFGRPGPIADH